MEEDELLTKKHLQELFRDIFDTAPKWYNLGLALGLSSDDLDKIRVLHRENPNECLRETIKLWLSRHTPRSTREALVCALRERTVGEDSLAVELERKYNSLKTAKPAADIVSGLVAGQSAEAVVDPLSVRVEADSCDDQVGEDGAREHQLESLHSLTAGSSSSSSNSLIESSRRNKDHSSSKLSEDGNKTTNATEKVLSETFEALYNGKNYEFTSPLPVDLMCQKCHHLAYEPQQMKCCGKLYCQSCLISGWCTVCSKKSESSADVRSDRQTQDLSIKCPNSLEGCSWEGRLGDVAIHRSSCLKEVVPCMYKDIGCVKEMYREELKKHEEDYVQIHLNYSLKKQMVMMKRIEQLEGKCADIKLQQDEQDRRIQILQKEAFPNTPILTVVLKKVGRDFIYYKLGHGDTLWISQGFFQHGYLLQLMLKSVAGAYSFFSTGSGREYFFALSGSNFHEVVSWPCRGTCVFSLKGSAPSQVKMKFSIEKPMKTLDVLSKISSSDEKELTWTQVTDRKVISLLSEISDRFEVNITSLYFSSSS